MRTTAALRWGKALRQLRRQGAKEQRGREREREKSKMAGNTSLPSVGGKCRSFSCRCRRSPRATSYINLARKRREHAHAVHDLRVDCSAGGRAVGKERGGPMLSIHRARRLKQRSSSSSSSERAGNRHVTGGQARPTDGRAASHEKKSHHRRHRRRGRKECIDCKRGHALFVDDGERERRGPTSLIIRVIYTCRCHPLSAFLSLQHLHVFT